MKEFEPVKDLSTRLEVVTPVKQEYKYIGAMKKIKGLKLYSYNPTSGKIELVSIRQEVAVDEKGNPVFITKANYDPKLLYVQALNVKNANRKFGKMLVYELKSINENS